VLFTVRFGWRSAPRLIFIHALIIARTYILDNKHEKRTIDVRTYNQPVIAELEEKFVKKLVLNEMPPHSILSGWRKHNVTIVEVEQNMPNYEAAVARRNRNAAFESWRQQLGKGDKLPRGPYFVGKKPGREIVLIDETWSIGL
jgi:hypothetical protein